MSEFSKGVAYAALSNMSSAAYSARASIENEAQRDRDDWIFKKARDAIEMTRKALDDMEAVMAAEVANERAA